MQCNPPFFIATATSNAPQAQYSNFATYNPFNATFQHFQPQCTPSPEVIGEGEVCTLILPDGNLQLYFLPVTRCNTPFNAFSGCNRCRNGAVWFVKSVSNPTPHPLFNMSPPMQCTPPCTSPMGSFFAIPPPPPITPQTYNFHNDGCTSSTDLKYCCALRRMCDETPKTCAGAQINTTTQNISTQTEIDYNNCPACGSDSIKKIRHEPYICDSCMSIDHNKSNHRHKSKDKNHQNKTCNCFENRKSGKHKRNKSSDSRNSSSSSECRTYNCHYGRHKIEEKKPSELCKCVSFMSLEDNKSDGKHKSKGKKKSQKKDKHKKKSSKHQSSSSCETESCMSMSISSFSDYENKNKCRYKKIDSPTTFYSSASSLDSTPTYRCKSFTSEGDTLSNKKSTKNKKKSKDTCDSCISIETDNAKTNNSHDHVHCYCGKIRGDSKQKSKKKKSKVTTQSCMSIQTESSKTDTSTQYHECPCSSATSEDSKTKIKKKKSKDKSGTCKDSKIKNKKTKSKATTSQSCMSMQTEPTKVDTYTTDDVKCSCSSKTSVDSNKKKKKSKDKCCTYRDSKIKDKKTKSKATSSQSCMSIQTDLTKADTYTSDHDHCTCSSNTSVDSNKNKKKSKDKSGTSKESKKKNQKKSSETVTCECSTSMLTDHTKTDTIIQDCTTLNDPKEIKSKKNKRKIDKSDTNSTVCCRKLHMTESRENPEPKETVMCTRHDTPAVHHYKCQALDTINKLLKEANAEDVTCKDDITPKCSNVSEYETVCPCDEVPNFNTVLGSCAKDMESWLTKWAHQFADTGKRQLDDAIDSCCRIRIDEID